MSACLFTVSLKWFDETPIILIRQHLQEWTDAMAEYETSTEQQTNRFYGDRYAGYSTNVQHGRAYLAGVDRGTRP
jgi:hypothetical protein